MKIVLFVCFIFFLSLNAKVIRFSPLPVDEASSLFKQYEPMLQYIEHKSNLKFEFVYSSNYKEMIKKFKDGKIDIIELGPLPFVKLRSIYKYATPFVTFLSKNGKDSYNCLMITSDRDKKNLKDTDNKTQIELTRKLSTCGYLMSEKMLQQAGLSLKDFNYNYVGTHVDVILGILLKQNSIGGVKSTVYESYKHFKHMRVLATSTNIPSFSFVANRKTLSMQTIQKIADILTKLHPLKNKKDFDITRHWGRNIRYGVIKTKKGAYKSIKKALLEIKIP